MFYTSTVTQPEYVKGSTPAGEMRSAAEAFARCCAAIKAHPDPSEAWAFTEQLGRLVSQWRTEQADFRAFLAAYFQDYYGWTDRQLAQFMGGVSIQTARKAVSRAREKGNPVTNPTTLEVQLPVVLAIVTSPSGVLVADRNDKVPPVTFPGGEIQPGESSGEAASRRVLAEAGLTIDLWQSVGQRIHDKTSRHMFYVYAETDDIVLAPGDPDDLSNVRWASVAELAEKMPDMYPRARDWLNAWNRDRES